MTSSPSRSSTMTPAGSHVRGQNEPTIDVVWSAGASIACCGSYPPTSSRSTSSSCHWSCWSPPGVPSAMTGFPSLRMSVGERVVRGRLPAASGCSDSSSSHVICSRVPRQKPSPGIAGEDCNHPPEGVAAIMFPHRSTTSMWQVSPRTAPESSAPASASVTANMWPDPPANAFATFAAPSDDDPPEAPGTVGSPPPAAVVSPPKEATNSSAVTSGGR